MVHISNLHTELFHTREQQHKLKVNKMQQKEVVALVLQEREWKGY